MLNLIVFLIIPVIEAQFKTYAREQGITLEECKVSRSGE